MEVLLPKLLHHESVRMIGVCAMTYGIIIRTKLYWFREDCVNVGCGSDLEENHSAPVNGCEVTQIQE